MPRPALHLLRRGRQRQHDRAVGKLFCEVEMSPPAVPMLGATPWRRLRRAGLHLAVCQPWRLFGLLSSGQRILAFNDSLSAQETHDYRERIAVKRGSITFKHQPDRVPQLWSQIITVDLDVGQPPLQLCSEF